MVTSTGSASPCGACKFLRRKCASDCIFAPYFCSEQGPARFASIHKIFGASNVSKLLMQVPLSDRSEAVLTIAYEAEARIRDPIYGCVAHIFALQQQVATLQAQLLQIKAQMAHNSADPRLLENYCPPHFTGGLPQLSYPQHFIGCMDQNGNGLPIDDGVHGQDLASQSCIKKRSSHTELNELQALAHRMMKN